MKKIMKAFGWVVAVFFAIVLVALVLAAVHPLWLGSAARSVANSVVPGMTGTLFTLDEVGINAYDGCLEVRGLDLGNPPGYDEPCALRIDLARIALEPKSLVTDVIHVKEVTVDGLFVSHVSKDGVNNFDAISANMKKDDAADGGESADDGEPKRGDEDSSEKKFIIDRISVSNVTIKYGAIAIPVPMTVVIRDVGKKSGGASPVQALMEILDQLFNAAVNAGVSAKDAVSLLAGETIGVTTNTVKEAKAVIKELSEGTLAVTADTVGETKNVVKLLTDGTIDVSSNAVREVKDLGKSLKEGVKGSFKDIKSIFKKQ